MAIISVPSATQGRSYNVKISGDVPTATEQARIAKYVADQDAQVAARRQLYGSQSQAPEAAPEKGGLAGIGTALGRGVNLTQQGAYSALEGIGSTTGIDFLRDFGKAGAEFETKQLEESDAARTKLEDVKGIGSGLSFVGETVAESAAPMGISILGAAAAGAAAGAAATAISGPGAIIGAGAGAIIGAAGAALSQVPLFYGWNRERQKQEDVTAGRPVEIDEGTAALAAIPQAAMDGVSDLFLVGKLSKLLPKNFINSGRLFTRIGKGSAAGVVAEVPTEVGQQVLERYQAGLPLTDDEAIEEYRQAAIAAAAAGGTIGGASAAIGGDQKAKDDEKLKDLKKKQLAEDSKYMSEYGLNAQAFADQNSAELDAASTAPTGEPQVTPDEMLMLPSPTAFGKSKLKVAPIINPAAYTLEMRKQALDIATSRGKVTIGELNQALTELNQSNVSPKAVASLVQDLKKDGILRRAGRNGLAPTKGALQSRARLDSLNNSATQFDSEAQSLSQRNEELAANLRAAEQTGVDLSGKKANPSDIGRQIDQNNRDIEARKKLAESARADALKLAENIAPKQRERTSLPAGVKAAPLSQATPKAALPRIQAIEQSLSDNSNAKKELEAKRRTLTGRPLSSVEQIALDDTNRKLKALAARRKDLWSEYKSPEEAILDAQNQEAADAAKALEAQAQAEAREQARLQRLGVAGTQQGAPVVPALNAKMQNVFDSLRQYMSKMNVGNLGLAGANILDSFNNKGERTTSEGLYNSKLRLISVSMGIYDPKLSEQELFDRIARVVDHEVIHALKSRGVFSDADWASLTRAASTMKYKAMRNGKLQDREYTYLERAQSMYAGESLDPPDWPNTTVALDLLSPQVLKELRKAAYQQKIKLGETVSISTIENLIGEKTARQVAEIEFAAEEAVAEMFRDYVDGRVKFVGKPKLLFDRIKDFFRALIGASIENGIPNAQSILDDIKSGAVGARQQGFTPQAAQPVAQPLSAARTPAAAPVVAAPVAPVQAPTPAAVEAPAPAQVQPAPEPVIAQAPEIIVEAPPPSPAPTPEAKAPTIEPEIKVDLPQKARKYGSVLKKGSGADGIIGTFAFSFESFRPGSRNIRAYTTDRSKIFQSSDGSERDAYVVDIWDTVDPNVVDGRRGNKVGINSVGENVPPDLAPIFREWLEGKIDNDEVISRIKNTDVGAADKSNGTSGVRQSKMTADFTRDNPGGEWLERKQARAEEYPEQKFMMGSITGVIGGRTNMFLPTNVLRRFAGLNDEKRGAGEVQYERLLADSKKNGFDQDQKGNKVVVAVNHYGQPYILEGNTRVAVASTLGIPTIKAEVRYWNGGEDVSGPMEPNKVLDMASPAVRQSKMTAEKAYKIRNDAYKERASLMGSKNSINFPTKAEMEAWIAQSDMRYQDAPRVPAKSIFSPEFKLFFGKSQIVVVDQNGVEYPRRVFHGGPHGDIYEFDFSKIGPEELGFHVGTAEQANEFAFGLPREKFTDTGNLYPLYVRLENPVRLKDLGSWTAENIFPQMRDKGLITEAQFKQFMIAARKGSTGSQEKIRNILQSLGYDGVSYLNRYEGFSQEDMAKAKAFAKQNGTTVNFFMNNLTEDRIKQFFPSAQDSYILLKPTQIKSAIGNNGEYSTLNKDIRYSALVPRKGNENAEGQDGLSELGRDRGTGDRSGGLSPLSGTPKVSGATGPDPRLNAVAEKYARDNGIDLYRQAEYVKIDRDLSTRLSDAYQDMLDDPSNPVVREAYENMIDQTTAQYKALVDDGYEFYFFDNVNDPYNGNPWNAMRDLRATKTMGVYATEAGYGSDDAAFDVKLNPLLADTGFRWSYGKDGEKNLPVLANDLFRAVHDAFGHGLEGSGFRARGEENAWQAHARLFTGTALHAMTSETRGQNSWLNFGPYGKENENAKVDETTFATQKIGLMPSWTWTEGKAGDQKKSLGDELKVRESRMVSSVKPVSNVPQELKRLTVLDMMDPKTGVYIQRDGKKVNVIDAINELFGRRSDVVITPDDPNAVELMSDLIALEAQMAILRNPSAIGWYGETLDLAKRVAAIMYPEICPVNPYTGEPSNSYSPMNSHIWDLATAITSNGQAVLDNFTHAAEQYEYWVVHGRFKLVGYGKQSTGIVAGLKFYNSMRDAGYSDEQVQKFFSDKMTVSELKKHPVVQELGLKVGSSEKASTEVYGSFVLGPKIGQGFYQNLRGNFTPLTMDIWFNRLFNRISGRPFAKVTDKTRLENFNRISALIDSPMISEYERQLLNTAKEVASIDVVTPENVGDLAIAYNKLFQRDFTNTKTREMKRLVSLGYDPKADETKALANAARPEKTALIQAMNTASNNFQQREQATPRGGGERAYMRQVIERAQAKVFEATGLDVNTADFQALLWYAEKQLFKAMNIREGRGGDNDYVDGVIHFLRSRGKSDDEIKRVLPASQRNRLTSGTDSGRQNAGVLSGTEGSDIGQTDSSNLVLPTRPNGDSEATVARNGGIGSRAKPKRGAAAVAEAKKDTPVRLSRLMAHTPQGRATPFTGHSDLLKHADSLRYAAVQGAVSRLIQRTVGKYFKIDPSIIEDKTTNFFKKMQDDMIHVGKLYDTLRGRGIDIPQEYDAYFQEQLMRDAAGAKKQDFQEGFLRKIIETAVSAKFDSTNISDLEAEVNSAIGVSGYITQIVKKVGNESHAIADAYLYALHAKERNKRISEMSKGKDTKGSGMSDAEADAILKWKNTLPRDQQNALEEVDKLAQDIIWMTNDEYIQGGLIPVYNDDKAILDDGTEVDFPQYDNYVPLRGFTDPEANEDAIEGGGGGGAALGSKSKPNKSAVGRTSYAGDILVNIGTQYEAAVDKAARNKVGQSFLSLLEDGGVDLSDIAFVYKSHPLMKTVVNGTIRTVPSRDFNDPDLPILPVRRNGKEFLIGFHDADVGAAMKGTMGSADTNVVMSAIHNVTRFYANLLTSWNPAFVLGNLPRDIETAIFNSQQYNMKGSSGAIIKKVGPSIKAIWGEINKTGAGDPHLRMRYRQFYENGGQSVFSGMVSLTNSTKGVKGIISEVEGLASGNAIFKSKHFFTKTLLGKIEAANDAVENGTRLAFFDAMMNELEAQGVPTNIAAKRAAFAAKNLTTNFTKGGEYRNFLNTAYLFYNASFQGSMAMMNSLVRSKNARKMAASIVVMGFMMDMLNAAASDDEDEDGILDYDNFNDNRLENYILIPDFSGTGTHISIPLAYGLNIFYNAGRTLSNFTRGIAGAKGTYTAGEAAASTIGKVTSTLNPFGGNNMLSILSPTQTDLIVELVTNKDFKDQPIYKELSPFDQSKSQSNLYWSSTSPSAVWMSKFINDTLGGGTDIIPGEILGNRVDIQPDIIEHVLGFLTGGLGTFVGASFDTATSTIPDAFAGRWEADMIGKTPILNKFLTKTTEKDKAGDYYDNRDKVMVVSAEIKDAIKSGDAERIAAARATYPERIKVMGRIAEIEKRLLKLRKTRKAIVKSATMPEDKKQKSLDNIDQAINKLMSLGNQIMGDAGV
jgi:hypothetical protein